MSATLTSSFWYLARGTGVVTLVLLTLVVALGIATRSGRPLPGLPRFAVAAVHRSSSLLTLVFLGIHIVTLLFDKYAQLKLLDLVIPFGGTYRPLWLGLGTLASDLLIALVITSLLRTRMGPKSWRAIHWAAYAAWPISLLHALGTGTDSGQLWMRAAAALSTITVAAAVVWRLSASFGARPVDALPAGRPGYGNPGYGAGYGNPGYGAGYGTARRAGSGHGNSGYRNSGYSDRAGAPGATASRTRSFQEVSR